MCWHLNLLLHLHRTIPAMSFSSTPISATPFTGWQILHALMMGLCLCESINLPMDRDDSWLVVSKPKQLASTIVACICDICPLYHAIVTEAVRVKSFIRFVSHVCVLLHGCMYRYKCMGLRATEGPVSCLSRCAVGYKG